MGFLRKIVSFFKRDTSDASEPEEALKSPDVPINPPSEEPDKRPEYPLIGDFDKPTDIYSPVEEPSTGDSSVVNITPNPQRNSLLGNQQNESESSQQQEESYIDRIRREEEERKKREWLEFLKTKRAKRRKELEEQLILIDKQLTFIQDRIIAIKDEKKLIVKKDAPDLSVKEESYSSKATNLFESKDVAAITSMGELFQLRIEEERRKIEEAEKTALINIEGAREAINNRNLDRAKECLDIISKQTAFIENKDINAAIKDVVFAITELSNQLEAEKREKEEQRRKQEALAAQQRAEAIERQRQEEEARKLREQEERRERARKYEEELREKEKNQQQEINRLNGLSSTLKSDAQEIVNFLHNNGIYYLYHFTESCNIPLIKSRKGLYSWSYLLSHDMKIPSPGGNDTSRGLDRDKGLEDYVRLSLCKSHPMAYRIHQESEGRANLVLLKIKLDVTMFESTRFSNVNATDKRAKIGSDLEFIEENLDFEAIALDWCWGSDPRHKLRQAEVMVKTFIPSKYIINLDNPGTMTFSN